MWKLTIKQSRNEEGLKYPVSEEVTYVNNSLKQITDTILFLAKTEDRKETEYKIERVDD